MTRSTRIRAICLAATIVGALAACQGPFASGAGAPGFTSGEWIDLTHTLGEDSVFWPTADPYRHEEVAYGETEGGYFYSSYNLHLSEHGGTHLDAPIHFAEGRHTVDKIALNRLIGPAAVIDVSAASEANRDYRFTREDVLGWEERHGRLPEGAIELFHTGFARYWPDREERKSDPTRGARARLEPF